MDTPRDTPRSQPVRRRGGRPAEYFRLLGIMLSIVIGLWFCRAQQDLGLLISIAALALTFRCVFENVIAPYYVFPTIASALVSVVSQPGRDPSLYRS